MTNTKKIFACAMPLLPTNWELLGTMPLGTTLCGAVRKTLATLWTTITPVLDPKALNKPIAAVATQTGGHSTLPFKNAVQTEPSLLLEVVKQISCLFTTEIKKSSRIEKILDSCSVQ